MYWFQVYAVSPQPFMGPIHIASFLGMFSVVDYYFCPSDIKLSHMIWFGQWNMSRNDMYQFPAEALQQVLWFHHYSFFSVMRMWYTREGSLLYPVSQSNEDTWNKLVHRWQDTWARNTPLQFKSLRFWSCLLSKHNLMKSN